MNGGFQTLPQVARQGVNARRSQRTGDQMGELAAAFDRLAETLEEQSDERQPNKQSIQEIPQQWLEVLSRFCRTLKTRQDIPSIQDLVITTAGQVFPDCEVAFCREQDRGLIQSERGRKRRAQWKRLGSAVREKRICASCADLRSVSECRGRFGRSKVNPRSKPGWMSSARVPLIAGGKAWGTLSLFAAESRTLSRFELQFLTLLADQAAAALQQARLQQMAEAQLIELQEAKNALTHAQRSKSDFLSIMSHEFRTPLNLIMGYTEIIQEELAENITADQSAYLQRIMKASEDILALVLSVLHVGSIESGSVELNKREVGLGALLDELRSDLTLPQKHGVDFVWDVPADLPMITTDGEKLKHVLYKLIDNAVKFTEQGQVRVSSKILAPLGQIEVAVSDTGVGIPNEALTIVFEKYRQLDGSIARMHDGMGLGLFIAKRLTEILGGKLDVASVPGKGSTFTVVLPVAV